MFKKQLCEVYCGCIVFNKDKQSIFNNSVHYRLLEHWRTTALSSALGALGVLSKGQGCAARQHKAALRASRRVGTCVDVPGAGLSGSSRDSGYARTGAMLRAHATIGVILRVRPTMGIIRP